MKIVVIAGGIGSGKSVVSRILRTMGYKVYDCDSNAKRLMNESDELKSALKEKLGEQTYNAEGKLNREYISSKVFNDAKALATINAVVHPAVTKDLREWAEKTGEDCVWVETALPHESRIDEIAYRIWKVKAPEDVRIERVMKRSGLTANEIKERIKNQAKEDVASDKDRIIVNDGKTALLPQIVRENEALKK
jgi:dephospho-CoA kinase